MKYCRKCVQPDTRPGIQFDEQGVCPPCQYMDKVRDVDWDVRRRELDHIIAFGREHNVSGYDCIIGVSGGKDSTRLAVYVREELGLEPLLVSCTYPPQHQSERGAHNLGNLIALGFDTITVSPAPQTWKEMMRRSFLRVGNFARSTEMALYASLPRTAIAYHIPLIFLGENPAIQLGDLGVGSLTWDANRMKEGNTIAGGPGDLLGDGIEEKDTIWYRYPSYEEMEWAKLKIVYLGYFWKDFTKVDNANFSVARGLEIREDIPANTGALHPFEALDEDFVVINQMMKYVKYGFGKVTDEACEEVRFGRMSRDEAVELIKKYDGRFSGDYVRRFCHYLDIAEQQFWDTVERFRNPDIWEQDAEGEWQLKIPVGWTGEVEV